MNPQDWLTILFGYNSTSQNGTPTPNSSLARVLNFIGAAVAYNATLGTVDVTFPTASNTPQAAIPMSVSTTLTSPALNATYAVSTSTVPIVVTIAGTPVDGVELTFVDATQLWPVHKLGFQPQSGAYVRNPEDVSATDTTSQINIGNVAGESFTLKWDAAQGKWFPS